MILLKKNKDRILGSFSFTSLDLNVKNPALHEILLSFIFFSDSGHQSVVSFLCSVNIGMFVFYST